MSPLRLLVSWNVMLVVAASTATIAAHEGHAPLPTKGVQVDVKQGLLTLSPAAYQALAVRMSIVDERTIADRSLAYATLVTPWQQQYFVSSPLAGRIAALHVTTGDSIEPGQLLAEIASPALVDLELELRRAANELVLSTRQAERLGRLAQEQAIPERDFIEATAKRELDSSAVHIARNKLLSLRIGAAAIDHLVQGTDDRQAPLLLPLFGPIRGSISHSDLALGKVVVANEHLFEVQDVSTLWVRIGVLERDVAHVATGQNVELEFAAYPREQVEAVIRVPPNYVDPTTHLATAWAELANPLPSPKYLPGMHGTAKIAVNAPLTMPTVPISALLGSGAERYVLVEIAATAKGHEYRRQNVVVAKQNSRRAQLQAGALFPGDRVVSVGGHLLSSYFVLGSLRLSPEGVRNAGLRIEPVGERIVERVLTMEGAIDLPPSGVATVSAQLPGTLARVLVDRGERVTAGQVLAEVAGLPVQDTQFDLLRGAMEVALLAKSLERLQSVGQPKLVAERRILELESARAAAQNRRDAARQSLIALGLSAAEIERIVETGQPRSTLPIRSPIDGVVVRFDKMLGAGVAADESLFEIDDASQSWARAYASEGEAALVRVGAPARVRILSDSHFVATGTIARTARTFDPESRTLAVWIELTDSGSNTLPRNLSARISLTIDAPPATLAVPRSAIVRDGSRHYVFVQREGGLLDRRAVEVGRSDDRYFEVRRGLQLGERVAVEGAAELQTTFAAVR